MPVNTGLPMTFTRFAGWMTVSLLLPLASASAQPLPPGNVPQGSAPPGVYSPPPLTGGPQSDSGNSVCVRLEGALAQLDASANSGPDASKRYEEAIGRQRFELDQTIMQGRRQGCDQSGGFFIFGRPRSPQCDQINGQITRMRDNLDRMTREQSRSRGGGYDANRDMQRRQILASLQQNNCGGQYRNAAPQQANRQRGFLEKLFGGWQEESNSNAAPLEVPTSSTFQTLCVRTCDGYYFPISYATVPGRFGEDERTCKRLCPATEVSLYTHRNPGEDMQQAVSISGAPYTQLPTAFKYRHEYDAKCSCRAPGQSWAEALGVDKDQTVQQGDIIVTEERAKQLAKPKQPGRPSASAPNAPAGSSPSGDAQKDTAQADRDRKVRIVGPEFYPVR
jgi:hypothetical protein